MNIKELKTLLKENNIPFFAYWDKERLTTVANEHNLLPRVEPKNERSKNDKYDRLKTIRNNLRTVTVEDVETGEIKTSPSIYEASKFLDTLLIQSTIGEIRMELGKINTKFLWNNFITFFTRNKIDLI